MTELHDAFTPLLGRVDFRSVLDILLVAGVIYSLLLMLRGTTAMSLLRGIAFVVLAAVVLGYFLQLTVVSWLLRNSLIVFGVAIPVIFQPEIRRALERVGRTNLIAAEMLAGERTVEIVAQTAAILAERRHGALIVIERETGLQEIVETGSEIDGKLSVQLLTSLFFPNSELHDGAAILRNGRIAAAGCVIPIGTRPADGLALGTRHRAAVSITEERDAVCVVVSEETGTISLAHNGRLIRGLDRALLQRMLTNLLGLQTRSFGRAAKPRKIKGSVPADK